jgi:hypothetical protein
LSIGTWLGVFLGIFILALGALVAPTGCPPQVYKLHGVQSPGLTYNVLFLGDGFSGSAELDAYRRATEVLTAELFNDSLFAPWRDAINVYRIDVQSSAPVDVTGCPATPPAACGFAEVAAPPPEAPQVLPADQNAGGASVVDDDLRTELCWSSGAPPGRCNALWMDAPGRDRALALALDALDIDVVVVLANAWNVAGGGLRDALVPASPSGGGLATLNQALGLAVLGLPSENGRLRPEAGALLAHELGHTLGLLDEYEYASGYPPAPPTPGRNVYVPGAAMACWVPAFGTINDVPGEIPWHSLLTCPWVAACDCPAGGCVHPWVPSDVWPSQNPCCGTWSPTSVPGGCTLRTLLPCNSDYVGNIPNACLECLGLWEGAGYQTTGAFRAQLNCRMRDIMQPFCKACGLVVAETLRPFGPPLP